MWLVGVHKGFSYRLRQTCRIHRAGLGVASGRMAWGLSAPLEHGRDQTLRRVLIGVWARFGGELAAEPNREVRSLSLIHI